MNKFLFLISVGLLTIASVLCFSPVFAQASGTAISTSTGSGSDADVPALVKMIATTIDKASGGMVPASVVYLVFGIIMIGVYRGLQWLAGSVKTPVGTMGFNALAALIGLLFGKEATWKNRVIAPGATAEAVAIEKQKVVDKLVKDHPILGIDLKKIFG